MSIFVKTLTPHQASVELYTREISPSSFPFLDLENFYEISGEYMFELYIPKGFIFLYEVDFTDEPTKNKILRNFFDWILKTQSFGIYIDEINYENIMVDKNLNVYFLGLEHSKFTTIVSKIATPPDDITFLSNVVNLKKPDFIDEQFWTNYSRVYETYANFDFENFYTKFTEFTPITPKTIRLDDDTIDPIAHEKLIEDESLPGEDSPVSKDSYIYSHARYIISRSYSSSEPEKNVNDDLTKKELIDFTKKETRDLYKFYKNSEYAAEFLLNWYKYYWYDEELCRCGDNGETCGCDPEKLFDILKKFYYNLYTFETLLEDMKGAKQLQKQLLRSQNLGKKSRKVLSLLGALEDNKYI